MKLQPLLIDSNNQYESKIDKKSLATQPAFKASIGDSSLNLAGAIMQWIQDKGFLASFLIQDGLGMTAPRSVAGFLRDKDVTGHYNVHEGFEVLGREGLTGPCMMAVAPLMLLLAAKFGKTTSVNSKLIRRFGDSLKGILEKESFNKDILKNAEVFQEEFFKINIKEFLTNTLGKGNFDDEAVNYILSRAKNYSNPQPLEQGSGLFGRIKTYLFGKSKYKALQLDEITKYINELNYNSSDKLELLNKLKVGSIELNEVQEFLTKDVIDAMVKYSDDAIKLNKNLTSLTTANAEALKQQSIAKRFITNVSTMAATLGVLSVLPKIYAKNEIAPGAMTALELKNSQALNNETNKVSFKGKAPEKSLLTKFGKMISRLTNEKFSSELEYNGHNFTNTLMAGLSVFGLLGPRGWHAYKRAQVDDNGKKDFSEIYEILLRDLTSCLTVVFAVPMLTRAFVTSYEKTSGFVLMNRDRSKSKIKTALDLLNPYSKSHVLQNNEIEALYNNVNNKSKMINFCDFISKNNGDLHKIISKSEELPKMISSGELVLPDMKNMTKLEKNNLLKKVLSSLNDGQIAKLMKGTGKTNKILAFARGLNSVPGLIATFIISPYILGWFIPNLTYANTRKMHENAAKDSQLEIAG